nr:MAG TPA: hypothetical protein [Caudoviricetes sp.]
MCIYANILVPLHIVKKQVELTNRSLPNKLNQLKH